jgi:hypothetical protein
MSDSAPSDSSATDSPAGFVTADLMPSIGIEMVEITRSDSPIFLAPELRWGAAFEEGIYGAPLDRLFGEEANAYVTGALDPDSIPHAIAAALMQSDPMVDLPGLADGLILAQPDEAPLAVGALGDDGHALLSADKLHTPEIVTLFDFGIDAQVHLTHLNETWSWDLGKGAWVFDHHA